MALITTGLNEGFDDENMLDRSFLSCLPRSVPEVPPAKPEAFLQDFNDWGEGRNVAIIVATAPATLSSKGRR